MLQTVGAAGRVKVRVTLLWIAHSVLTLCEYMWIRFDECSGL